MAEAEILQVIEELNSFLIHEDPESLYESLRVMVERVIHELRLFQDFLLEKKLEEGSKLKYWACDMAEIAQHALYIINDRDPWNYSEMASYLKPICRALSDTRKHILQLEVEGGQKSPTTSLSPEEEGGDEYVVDLEENVESTRHKSTGYSGRDHLSTIRILGMTGIGKTTLARKLYNQARAVDRCEPCVWLHVSGEWSNKELLMKLILQVLHNKDQSALLEEMENADNQRLQWMLYRHLQGKNFVVVLDNIWKFPYFKSIWKALPNENNQSRLLVTSRFQSIKYRLQAYVGDYTLEMKPLDNDRSWQLFSKLLLFGNQQFPKQLELRGKDMLRRCNGLPLSIKEVATQFVAKRRSGSEWEELLESIDLSATLVVLESIYHIWPPQVKSNFLCLSFFKIGIPVRREKLVHVWTAGKVIPIEEEEGEKYLEYYEEAEFDSDILEGYKRSLIKLIDESVVEVDRSEKNGCIKCIRINASFHTLSMEKAQDEMVYEILKKGEGNQPSSREPCHRAIYCDREEFSHFTDHDQHLISLFFRGGGYFNASEPYWVRFKQLRTLDFESFGLKILSETIGALIELRYLGLRDNYIQKLPESLGCLKKLEVLDIALNFVVEVPDIVWKLTNLRHMYMSDIICRNPLKIDTLKNLETLTYISIDNWKYNLSSLKMMTSLRKLGLKELDENSNLSEFFASAVKVSNLKCLILRGSRFRSLPSLHGLETLSGLEEITLDGLLTKLPSVDIFPMWVSHLSLINSSLDEDPMPKLIEMSSLEYLKLKNAYKGQQIVMVKTNFTSLGVLCLEELWHLRNIQVYNRLVKLEIKNCPYLEKFPENIINDNVDEMKMLTTKRLAAKIRTSDNISKVEHVVIQP